jgi:hypothetical protein
LSGDYRNERNALFENIGWHDSLCMLKMAQSIYTCSTKDKQEKKENEHYGCVS